jgi:ketosteroid isomerase-like protein
LATVSDGNLDIVRNLYAAWHSDQPETAPLKFLDDDFEYVNPPYAVHPGTRRGKDGWITAIQNLSESFESWGHVPGEMIDAGERIVVMTTFKACGRGSSVDLEKFEPHIWTLRDEKVIRFQWFNGRDEALEAAGLAE